MLRMLIAAILIIGIVMCGFRRLKLLTMSYLLQSLCIAVICLFLGMKLHSSHYFILFLLTLIVKVCTIPYVIHKAMGNIKQGRETDLIINSFWSYIISGIGVVITYMLAINSHNELLKAGIVLMSMGAMLIVGRKTAIAQMLGFLTLENGVVLVEISMIEMVLIMEVAIVMEVLILALIMGVMIFYISKTLDSINTDHLSNLKE